MALEKWDAGARPGTGSYPAGSEIFVIDGSFSDENGNYEAGHWLRFPIGAEHRPQTDSGCALYIKRGGLSYLRSEEGEAPYSVSQDGCISDHRFTASRWRDNERDRPGLMISLIDKTPTEIFADRFTSLVMKSPQE